MMLFHNGERIHHTRPTFRQEIPWNLFSPKAPYNGKVVANDFHPQTLTEPTGDANWETTHVTFDHGGKVPYIEGQSIGVI